MPYSQLMAAALTGASQRQLGHWRGTGFFLPESHPRRPFQYSFRDLVALRTFVYLRQETSLQKIRKAVGGLRAIGELDHISRYRLVAEGSSIVLVDPDGKGVDLVERPGHDTVVVMADVLGEFRKESGELVPNLRKPRRLISVDPDLRGGYPVIAGTRVPYDLVAGLVADGVPPGRVHEFYPLVSEQAAENAADFAQYVSSYSERSRVA